MARRSRPSGRTATGAGYSAVAGTTGNTRSGSETSEEAGAEGGVTRPTARQRAQRVKHQACPLRDRGHAAWHRVWECVRGAEHRPRYVTCEVTKRATGLFSDEKSTPHRRRGSARQPPPIGRFKHLQTTTRACIKRALGCTQALAWTLHSPVGHARYRAPRTDRKGPP